MKILKKLQIAFIVLAFLTGALGLGFLIDTLVLGENVANALIYSIVSAVSFFICIVLITAILVISILEKKENKKASDTNLIVLPSKKNKSFDARDVSLLTVTNPDLVKTESPCLIERDINSCYTCKCRLANAEELEVQKTLIKKNKKSKNVVEATKESISGVSKESGLIVLKQKKQGKVFVPHPFVEWPEEEVEIIELVQEQSNDDIKYEPIQEIIVEELVNNENAELIILDEKQDGKVFEPQPFVEWPEEAGEIVVEEEIIEEELPPVEDEIILGPIVEEEYVEEIESQPVEDEIKLSEVIEKEIIEEEELPPVEDEIILGPVVEEEYVEEIESQPVEDEIIEDIVEESNDDSLEEMSVVITPNPLQPIIDYTLIETRQPKELLILSPKKPGLVFVPHPFVEWPEEAAEPVVNGISINDAEIEKELVVEAEELFENEEIVGDDSHVFIEHEEVKAVAMTLKKTITSSLFTGKQNIVFVKRPPVRLFNKIYIIDRASESIIGEATVKMYERGLKKQIWKKYQKNSTITKDQYDTYYSSSLLACALVIKTVSKYRNPAPIANYGIGKVPSTFLYI